MSLTSLFDELDVVKDSSHCSELIVAYLVLVIVSVSLITTLLTEFKNSLYDPADLCYLICIVLAGAPCTARMNVNVKTTSLFQCVSK